ncbi:MAG TPA: Do family serine endopeptidase [Burkholderiaceae bacterium]|nr:Do family serine endopeptidase [Burkholderiaceae bacterium]
MKTTRFVARPLVAALLATGLLSAGAAGALNLTDWLHKPQAASAPAAAAPAPVPVLPTGAPNFRAIVHANAPAVVGVTVEGTRKLASADAQPGPDDPFFQFFRGLPGMPRMPFGGRDGGQEGGSVPFRGQGSGFVVSADGVVLTNAHVVRDAKEVTVKLSDRREYRAKVLGSDPATDVAVLKLEASDLPTVTLGDPGQIEVGDYVLAIGAPYGLEQSATQGIVSAKGRSLPGDSFVPFIQTDAAVNPGNSGGPLFDANGRVVGINAQIYSQSGGFQGLAFAIPIDVALKVKDQILAHGRVDHARLGVTVQDLSQALAESFGLPKPDGALVASVTSGSAAERAELKPGDVITQIDGQPVHTAGDVSARVGSALPGEKLRLSVWRDKAGRQIDVKLGAAGRDQDQSAAAEREPRGALGLAVRPLTPEEKREVNAGSGLLVEQVDGAAARAGVRPGDIVLALNGQPVTGVEQIRRALERHPKHVALLIQRDEQRIFVPVELG